MWCMTVFFIKKIFLRFDVAVGTDGRPVLVGEGGELQAVEGEDALAHVLLGVVATSAFTAIEESGFNSLCHLENPLITFSSWH